MAVLNRVILVAFIAVVFGIGGGSRADITSLLVLRPFALACAGIALFQITARDLKRQWRPLAFIFACAALPALQLVPLPPSLWHSVPGRELIAGQDAVFGQQDLWRPVSMSPSKTWNALISLIVPLAAILLLAIARQGSQRLIILALLAAGAASAILGLAQISGPPSGPLYLYAITNEASAVGLFANRNHQSFFLAAILPLAAWYGLYAGNTSSPQRGWIAGVAALGLLFLIVVVSTGSRTGLVLFALSLVACGALVATRSKASRSHSGGRSSGRGGSLALLPQRYKTVGMLVGALVLVGAAFAIQDTPAYKRMSEQNISTDARVDAFPIAAGLIKETFPFGTGIGSFEYVFQTKEPDSMLGPTYLNQAHDDWLQLVLEGGLWGAALILVAVSAWLAAAWRAFRLWRTNIEAASCGASALFGIAVLALASLTDYPLRLPSMMVLTVLLAGIARADLAPEEKLKPSRDGRVEH